MGDNVFVKIIVVGQQNVGKTCILARYSRDQFDNTCPPTLGMDFQSKLLEYKGKTIRLQLWDIAGQERYNSVSKLYVRGACGAIIVSDIKEEQSLQNSLKWKKMIEESCDLKNGKPIPMILVQNKVDELKGVGQILPFQLESHLREFAATNGFNGSLQVSAKDNTNIPDLFNKLIDEIDASGFLAGVGESGASEDAGGNFGKSAPKSTAPQNNTTVTTSQQQNSNPTQASSSNNTAPVKLSNKPSSSTPAKKKGCC